MSIMRSIFSSAGGANRSKAVRLCVCLCVNQVCHKSKPLYVKSCKPACIDLYYMNGVQAQFNTTKRAFRSPTSGHLVSEPRGLLVLGRSSRHCAYN